MKSRIYLFNTACIVLISIFSSCHTSRQAVASRNKQPKFIDDIYMNRHEKSNKTVSGTPRHDKAAEASGNDKLGQESTIPENMPALSKKEMNSLLKKYAELLGGEA